MFFYFVFFFFGQIGGTVAQSVDGDVYFGWLKSLAWRRVAFCGFIHIYIYCTDFVRYIVETHTNTGGHGITDFCGLSVIEIRAGTLKKSGDAYLYL